ncbi:MAG: glycosyltransferase [Thermoplasmatales archaeon]
MRVAYVGDFINHGKSLPTIGTSIVILLSMVNEVESIDVYCPEQNETIEDFKLPHNVKLIPCYKYDNSQSILRLLSLKENHYDRIIFNLLPTGFGTKGASNLVGLMIPLSLRILFKQKNVRVLYHNSVFTNDIKKLGYISFFNKIRAFFLGFIERELFKNLETFVLLDLYKQRITKKIGANKVKVMGGRYLEAIASIYINNKIREELHHTTHDPHIILIHGNWGPQKNLELGLDSLRKLRQSGKNFRLVISGGINHHFRDYEKQFNDIIQHYSDIIYTYKGYVREKDIMELFLMADLVLLPYNAPGGHSGVLEQAIAFHVQTVSIDFPEYREQKMGNSNIVLSSIERFGDTIFKVYESLPREYKENIEIKDLIALAKRNAQALIS